MDDTIVPWDELIALLSQYGDLLNITAADQIQVQVRADDKLVGLVQELKQRTCHLVTVVGNDERELEDRRYKIYYVFSAKAADVFITVEYLLERRSTRYRSIVDMFPAVAPFESEMLDMLGLQPDENGPPVRPGRLLHECYPPRLYPLRRTRTTKQLQEMISEFVPGPRPSVEPLFPTGADPTTMTIPVGPIHAGVIESGQFWFHTYGEVIERLDIRLGFTHRGIERMFQSRMSLLNGWRLAEQVSGDSSFAHSLAYCRAAEALTDTAVPWAADVIRAVLLELERIHNHVFDLSTLAEDVGLDRLSADLARIRERLLRLNHQLTGHRYLRGVNRVGGVILAKPLDVRGLGKTLTRCGEAFEYFAQTLAGRAGFRDRTIDLGILNYGEAVTWGVTGPTARASGVARDYRWDHPVPPYEQVRYAPEKVTLGTLAEATAGDVFARALTRIREVQASLLIIEELLDELEGMNSNLRVDNVQVRPENNYTSALGFAEGFRGDVVYWVMQDKMNGIYRCKVRDPSMLNWPALAVAASPRSIGTGPVETLIADFPLLNKSFNLSYAGNDL